MGRHLPQGQVPLVTTAQATTAQVTTAPGGQLPLGDNCPCATTAPVTAPVTAPSNLPLVMVMLGFLTIPWLG